MIAIEVNYEYLVLPKNLSLNMVLESPLFGDKITGEYSYGFDIDNIPENRRILGMPESIDNTINLQKEIDCILDINGLRKAGKLSFTNINNNTYNVNIRTGALDLKSFFESNLKDFAYEGSRAIPAKYAQQQVMVLSSNLGDTVTIELQTGQISTLFNTDDYQTLQDLAAIINGDTDYLVAATAKQESDPGGGGTINAIELVSTVLGYATNIFCNLSESSPGVSPTSSWTIAEKDGYYYQTGLFINTYPKDYIFRMELRDFIFINMGSGPDDMDFCFPLLVNEKLHDGKKYEGLDYENNEPVNKYDSDFIKDKNDEESNNAIAFPYVLYVLRHIIETAGYSISGDWLNDDEIQRLIIYNNYVLGENGTKETDCPGMWFFDDIYIENHLPDIVVSDFLKALKNSFFIAFVFNNNLKTIEIVALKDVLEKNASRDETGKVLREYEISINDTTGYTLKHDYDTDDEKLSEVEQLKDIYNRLDDVEDETERNALSKKAGDIVLQTDENNYYLAVFDPDTGTTEWEFLTYNLLDFTTGINADDHSLMSSTLVVEKNTIAQWGINLRTPVCSQEGVSLRWGNDNVLNKLRFLFDRGMYNYFGTYYRYANNDELDPKLAIAHNYSLRLDGYNGIYNVWAKNWLQFLLNSKEIVFSMNWGIADLIRFDWTEKLIIDGAHYLVEKIEFNATHAGINNVKLTTKKINQYSMSDFEKDCYFIKFSYPTMSFDFTGMVLLEYGSSITLTPVVLGCSIASFSFEIDDGALPSGLSIHVSGTISGTTDTEETVDCVIKATDSIGNEFYRRYIFKVGDGGEGGEEE